MPSREKKKRHKKVKSGTSGFRYAELPSENPVDVEFVTSGLDSADPLYSHFSEVFSKLQPVEAPKQPVKEAVVPEAPQEEEVEEEKGLSRKQRRKLKRLDVAQLKQLVARPDVVEVHDATAADPRLLIYLKSYRNTIPVPKHWSQKRKYLQGKRGFEKPPFALPHFIADTGIAKIREGYLLREETKRQKQKMKDKVQPRLGKIDIDYQVLHDAFFKYQTKPKLTKMGDLYYEGREFEVRLPDHRPGHLSERLRKALGMPDGAPPPWLINMQRHGPPPAYPTAKIPGLSAPIPPGASFGYHPGGWGKPPVDEHGNPLYGDVFGSESKDEDFADPVESKLWGELEEESVKDDSDEEEAEERIDEAGFSSTVAPLSETGFTETTETNTGTETGTETPDIIQLKKFGVEDRKLYHNLEPRAASVGTNLMGSAYTYAMPSATDLEVALHPSEIENYQDPNLAQQVYARAAEEQQEKEEAELRRKKREREKSKPHKSFKF
eukprot:NODE_1223_length_1629_cov_45.292405_g1088_i0.p1 GENE.NODE_1223_length_1629_cov_45.292405_g1088_i0~~NODE_1223_length_1629_cov_45.292405_g1088_i0.p1  ORF type:complete len:494 (-),score=111.86 NODE_1223_length_1629_cov_45.292405_g1088_i0:63-1544(-)